MLIIRTSQLERFSSERRCQFSIDMCRHLRAQFHDALWPLDEAGLLELVDRALTRAWGYGLHTERDCTRFLNLAVVHGWDFEQQPQHGWMRALLTDPQVSSPSQRLHRLVDQCIYRSEVEENNRQLRLQLRALSSIDTHPLILTTKE